MTIGTRLSILQLTYFSALAGLMNYLTLYLSSLGLGEMQIGLFHAAGSLGIVLQQWLFGRLLDRTGRFRAVSAGVMFACGALSASFPFMERLLPLEIVLILIQYVFMKRYGNVFDLWIYRLREDMPDLRYGSTRGMGSLGEGTMGLIMGSLIAWKGWNAMFAVTSVLLFMSSIASSSVPDPSFRERTEGRSPSKFRIRGPLLSYFASFLVLKTASSVVSIFAPLLLERLGGGPDLYGRIIFICALFELLTFGTWGKVMKKIGQRRSYVLSIVFSVICCLLLSLSRTVLGFTAGRILLSVSFVTYTLSHLEYIDMTVSEENKGQAVLTLSALSSGLGYMVSSLLGGAIMESGTPLMMAFVTLGINLLAYALHFRAFPGRKTV